jgi:hypothetical protein
VDEDAHEIPGRQMVQVEGDDGEKHGVSEL